MGELNWRKQLALAIALFILGSAAYWLEYKHKPQTEEKEAQSKKLFALKDSPVRSFRIVSGGDNSKIFQLHCLDFDTKLCKPGDNSKWELLEPSKLKADDSNSNSLLSTLNNTSVTETIDLKDETPDKKAALLKEYGLDPAARAAASMRKIMIETDKGTKVLYLGVTHPIGEGIFSAFEEVPAGQKPTGKINENQIHLLPSYFKSNFEKELTYWRDKKIMTLTASEVASFQLEGTKTKLTAVRKDGQWTLQVVVSKKKTEEVVGDIENIDSMLGAVAYLSAKEFASDNKNDAKAQAALKGFKPIVSMVIQKNQGTAKEVPAPIALTFYQQPAPKAGPKTAPKSAPKGGKLYATVSNLDPLFELDASAKDRVDKDLKDLRLTKLITTMDRFSAKRLEFTGAPIGATPLVLVSKDGKWIHESDKTETVDTKVQSFLDKISGNRIKEFLAGSAIPSGEAEGVKFTLADEKAAVKRQVVFWKKDSKFYARDLFSKRAEAFLVDPAIQADIPWSHAFFQKPITAPSPTPGAKAGK
ncbi:DUF4340 domain-containing protein [Bdellovibrionota bacterium FG-2]